MDSTMPDNSSYVILEGLSIEMATSEFEVFITPDIDISKNMSTESATSSIRGETGAPMVKHLHTFSQEEEEIDLSTLSICSTEEEQDEDVKNKMKPQTEGNSTNSTDVEHDEEDTENNCPSGGRYRRPLDSFSKKEQVQNQRQLLSIITALVPPTDTDNKDVNPSALDPRNPQSSCKASSISPFHAMKEKKGKGLCINVNTTDNTDVIIPKELDPRSPRILGELHINSPQNCPTDKKENGTQLTVKQKIRGWENYVLSSGVLPAPRTNL
ncbi:hypothetical protein ACHAXN_003389 [Cyclotella atomus]